MEETNNEEVKVVETVEVPAVDPAVEGGDVTVETVVEPEAPVEVSVEVPTE